MDMTFEDLPAVIQACSVLHNICEMKKEAINQQVVQEAKQKDKEIQVGCTIAGSVITARESTAKEIRNIFVTDFD